MKIRLSWFVFAILVFPQAWAQGPSAIEQAAMNAIRPDAIRAHMRFLSDSLLQGRGTGTPGYEIAARYVATELETMSLQAAGLNGRWYQTVPLRKSVLIEKETLLFWSRKTANKPCRR
jgi:hypothetical protein